jgi:hypothetical protein
MFLITLLVYVPENKISSDVVVRIKLRLDDVYVRRFSEAFVFVKVEIK